MKNFEGIETVSQINETLLILENFLPRSAMLYNILKLKSELLNEEKTQEIQITVMTHTETDSFVGVIRVKRLPQNLVVIFSQDKSKTNLLFLKDLERLITWSEPNQFEGLENDCAKFIKVCGEKYGRLELHDPIQLYTMDLDLAKSFSVSEKEGISVSQLLPEDAQKIDNLWPASCPGSFDMIGASIKFIGSGGVFINEGSNRNLVSWAVALPFGSIHALHTIEGFQGKGFAKLTMQQVSKSVAGKGRIPVAQIYKDNDTSKGLNERIGFTYSHDINLIHYYPISQMSNRG